MNGKILSVGRRRSLATNKSPRNLREISKLLEDGSRDAINHPQKKVRLKIALGQGGKRKLSRKQENRVLKKAKKGKDAPEIASEMSKEVKGGIKERTIQRTLKEGGLKYLVREERQTITRKQAQKRLAFCKKYLNHDWRLCLFMDEKTFEVGTHKKKGWQDPHDRTVTKVTRHPIKVHVWAGIGRHFKTKLYFFKQNLNSDIYCKILKSRLPPAKAFDLKPHEGSKWILVQDNDPNTNPLNRRNFLIYWLQIV
jgi:transposase